MPPTFGANHWRHMHDRRHEAPAGDETQCIDGGNGHHRDPSTGRDWHYRAHRAVAAMANGGQHMLGDGVGSAKALASPVGRGARPAPRASAVASAPRTSTRWCSRRRSPVHARRRSAIAEPPSEWPTSQVRDRSMDVFVAESQTEFIGAVVKGGGAPAGARGGSRHRGCGPGQFSDLRMEGRLMYVGWARPGRRARAKRHDIKSAVPRRAGPGKMVLVT